MKLKEKEFSNKEAYIIIGASFILGWIISWVVGPLHLTDWLWNI